VRDAITIERTDSMDKSPKLLGECFKSFLRNDHATTLRLARELGAMLQADRELSMLIGHQVMQIGTITLQRQGKTKALEMSVPSILALLRDRPWEKLLFQLTVGAVEADEVLDRASDATERSQAHFYIGTRYLTLGQEEAGREELLKCVNESGDCIEHDFARATLEALDSSEDSPEQRIDLLTRRLNDLYQHRRFVEAVDVARELGRLTRDLYGKKSAEYANALGRLAGLYYYLERFKEARATFEEVGRIAAKTVGKDHPQYAAALSGLALIDKATGDFSRAESTHLRILGILGKSCGDNHPLYATALANLAECYRAMERYADAESHLRQALEISAKTLGETHPDTVSNLTALVEVCEKVGKDDEAEELRQRLRAIGQRPRP
jgi:tetratricopeptide (TPR) repeat protein